MIAAVVAILLFMPAAAVYGRYRARRIKAEGATLTGRLAALLPMPLFFGVCGAIAIIARNERPPAALADLPQAQGSVLDTGNGVIDAALTLARWLGELELILFMIAIPFLLGALVAAVLLVLDHRGAITLPDADEAHPGREGDPQP